MQELVRSPFHTRPRRSRRLPSFAGTGLPERMRSTAFVFLGLTAAAGLALVAIFAQLNFPLLPPVPLPGGSSEGGSVAKAVALADGKGELALAPAQRSVVVPAARDRRTAGGAVDPAEPGVGAVGAPAPLSAPQSDGEGADSEPTQTPPSTPVPPSAPASSGAPDSTSQSTPPPPALPPAASPEPDSKPDKKPTKSKAAKPDKKKPKPDRKKPDKTKPAKTDSKAVKGDSKSVKAEGKAVDGEAQDESMAAKEGAKSETDESKASEPEGDSAQTPSVPSSEDQAAMDRGKGRARGHEK